MHIFFAALATICIGFWSTTLSLAIWGADPLMHFYFGLIGTVACLLTHCWVFFYFIGTGQGIREGVLAHNLDHHNIKLTKKFKGKTFPFALFSMIFMIVASTTGSGARFQSLSSVTHSVWVGIAIAFNLFTFWQEYRVIQQNRQLMQKLNTQVGS